MSWVERAWNSDRKDSVVQLKHEDSSCEVIARGAVFMSR